MEYKNRLIYNIKYKQIKYNKLGLKVKIVLVNKFEKNRTKYKFKLLIILIINKC